jgi:hypothetical protein
VIRLFINFRGSITVILNQDLFAVLLVVEGSRPLAQRLPPGTILDFVAVITVVRDLG